MTLFFFRLLRVLWLALTLTLAALPQTARATPLLIGKQLCHAIGAGDIAPPSDFTCTREPAGYSAGTLWLRAKVPLEAARQRPVLLVHQTRFDRLIVWFDYADGFKTRQQVRQGDFGSRWRIGGQILFDAPVRPVPLVAITIGFEHLTSHELVRISLLPDVDANRALAATALLAALALGLLLIGVISNLSLAIAARRQYLAWQGAWIGCMLLWGLLWSQAALILWPQLAGTAASRAGALLGNLAFASATVSIALGLGGIVPRAVRRAMILSAVVMAAIGLAASFRIGRLIDELGLFASFLTLANLAACGLCIVLSWRRGSDEARDLAKSWAVPTLVIAVALITEMTVDLPGGASQLAALLAAALQALWVSATATLRLPVMQAELEKAQAAESVLAELASRDPLTGLLNRRGFIQCLEETFVRRADSPVGLLLMDLDLFKSINDAFGHEAGDAVLCRVAEHLRRLEGDTCICGRMGGEEFVIAVQGLGSPALARFGEMIREGLAAIDHEGVSRHRQVTVSIGIAEGSTHTPFQKLYASADRALYDAKRTGRNKVSFASRIGNLQLLEELERDQLGFPWAGVSDDAPQSG